MADQALDRLLLGLGAQLEGSERRADEVAADDLALSLAQDQLLADALCRGGAVTILEAEGRFEVSAVGRDFLWVERPSRRLIGLEHAVLERTAQGEAPAWWDLSLVQVFRKLARSGARVEVRSHIGSTTGRVRLGARDFVALDTSSGQIVFARRAVTALRILSEGSADCSHDLGFGRRYLGGCQGQTRQHRRDGPQYGVRRPRLLIIQERGSTSLESIFAIAFLMVLAMGIAQLALTLYGRNVVISSAHEGARAATELGRSVEEAEVLAKRTTRSAAGSLVDDLDVIVTTEPSGEETIVQVRLTGRLAAIGPVPVPLDVDVTASSMRPGDVE